MRKIAFLYSISLLLLSAVFVGCASSKPDTPKDPNAPVLTLVAVEQTPDRTLLVPADPDTLQNADIPAMVELMPRLIGGLSSVQKHVKYPKHLRKQGIQGRVITKFVVTEKGKVTEVGVLRSVHPELDQLAMDAVSRARFEPGMQEGKPVPVKMSLPITFSL